MPRDYNKTNGGYFMKKHGHTIIAGCTVLGLIGCFTFVVRLFGRLLVLLSPPMPVQRKELG